ncbi:hypothetical protein DEO72_LG1g2504 [Vigna unguiculata]|uniref:Uncharacterized protein n=1 Tax=Vigna unguiculata TaxID=3917 RepID=A0A4D6KMK7_VIGUN|nr:hypothetical protein DEO72_LG1g2504 [Vigna unguiculata]
MRRLFSTLHRSPPPLHILLHRSSSLSHGNLYVTKLEILSLRSIFPPPSNRAIAIAIGMRSVSYKAWQRVGVRDDLEAKKVVLQKSISSINSNGNVNINDNNGNDSKKNEKSEGKKGFKTISLTKRFNCRVKDLFKILMDENRWKGFYKDFTHSNAKISKEVGSEFSIFNGFVVSGRNLEL